MFSITSRLSARFSRGFQRRLLLNPPRPSRTDYADPGSYGFPSSDRGFPNLENKYEFSRFSLRASSAVYQVQTLVHTELEKHTECLTNCRKKGRTSGATLLINRPAQRQVTSMRYTMAKPTESHLVSPEHKRDPLASTNNFKNQVTDPTRGRQQQILTKLCRQWR